jgi:phage-related protein
MNEGLSLKPLIWVGSSRNDLREFFAPAQDHMGYALYMAQRGGKHRNTETLGGFGGAGVLEVTSDLEIELIR